MAFHIRHPLEESRSGRRSHVSVIAEGNAGSRAQRYEEAGTYRGPDSGGLATAHGSSGIRLFPSFSLFCPVVRL